VDPAGATILAVAGIAGATAIAGVGPAAPVISTAGASPSGASAPGRNTARLDAATVRASAPAAPTAPSPAEGHSPQLTQELSGPLSGTGLARAGSGARLPERMREATAAAASTVVNGLDISSAQHPDNAPINWSDVAAAGYRFVSIKATEGTYYANPYYPADARAAAAAGMYVAPYAFANPYDPQANGTAQQQAEYAASEAGLAQDPAGGTDYAPGGRYLPLVLDLEYDPYATQDDTSECYGLSAPAMVTWVSSFMSEATALTGTAPIIYTPQAWWDACTGHSTAFGGDVLWVPAYAAGSPGALPAGWSTWNMWQYTSSGTVNGITGQVDLDYFSGVPETEQTTAGIVASFQVRTLSALAGQAETYAAAGLPPGVTMTPGGLVSGTPTAPGSYSVTIRPSAAGTVVPASMAFTWDVQPVISVTSPGSQATVAGDAVDLQVAATVTSPGAAPPDSAPSFTATGLPPGLSVSSSGLITGWPYAPGTYHATVTAAGPLGSSASASFTWTISQAADAGATGEVVLLNGGKCLDDTGSSTANGNRIQIWACNGDAAQKWTVVRDGTIRVLGKCLDVTGGGTSDGTAVQLWSCIPGDANQRWQAGTGTELINPHSGKCLDDPYSRTGNGTKLDIWTCNGGPQQRWTLPAGPVASGVAGKCLDDTGYSTSNGNKIQSWQCDGGTSQNWTAEPDGTVRVYGKCLDVTGYGTTSGTAIQLWSCDSGDRAQQWRVVPAGVIAGELVNPNSGMCLADPGDSAVNGTKLVIEPCSAANPGMSWNIRLPGARRGLSPPAGVPPGAPGGTPRRRRANSRADLG
jgi:GH25 family lysozyme M1 (1,4-beta-N-acetylmuramidase)